MVSTATLPAPARVPFRAKFHNGLAYICNALLAGWDVSEEYAGEASASCPPFKVLTRSVGTNTQLLGVPVGAQGTRLGEWLSARRKEKEAQAWAALPAYQ